MKNNDQLYFDIITKATNIEELRDIHEGIPLSPQILSLLHSKNRLLRVTSGLTSDRSDVVKEKGLSQITDGGEIEKIIKEVILKNPKVVDDFKKGKQQAAQFLLGQIMAQSRGKANPATAREILLKLLTS